MVLPTELIDRIFSFLQEDISALKACSKALPLYSILAERYIYAHIIIDPLGGREVCTDIPENPRFLDYPRTLEIRPFLSIPNPLAISIMRMIPQMANLISLRISRQCPFNDREEFCSTLRNCLQQSSFQRLHLFFHFDFPLSVLDGAKNIKHLMLSNCTAGTVDEPISSLLPSQLSLETLVLSGDFNRGLHRWATRWVTRLTTLELSDLRRGLDWTAFPELLVACSNSLTRLHLDMLCTYLKEFPFTFATLMHLKRLSISALIDGWALPEIVRLVNTAPAIPDVVLRFHNHFSSLARLDWSPLGHLQSNLTGKRPRINLCVTEERRTPEGILDALAANETIMDLVKGGLVIRRSDCTSVWGD